MKPAKRKNRKTATNERFGVMAAEARRKRSRNLQLPAPQEVQWKPPLRQAAPTLAASRRTASSGQRRNDLKISTI